MVPKVRASFTILTIDNNKSIVAAEIPEVLQEEKPCYYKGAGIQKGAYIRVGDSDEHMSAYEIYNLMAFKKRFEEDLRVVERTTIEDLDKELLNKYLNKIKENRPNFSRFDDTTALEKLGIIKKENRILA